MGAARFKAGKPFSGALAGEDIVVLAHTALAFHGLNIKGTNEGGWASGN